MKRACPSLRGPWNQLKPKPTAWLRLLLCGVALVVCAQFSAMPAQQTQGGTATLQVIVVDTEAKAETVLQRLKAGEDFSAVAKAMSIDPNASNGGYVRDADPALLRPELRQAVESMK